MMHAGLRIALLLLLVPITQSCYVVSQAYDQGIRFLFRKDIEEALQDPALPQSQKTRLKDLANIMEFAKSQGLRTEGAYQKIILIPENESVSYIVQAAYPDRLELDTWWFPIVGSVPYLGYADRKDRDAKAESLAKLGFDIYRADVGAFSSLGWFEDPLFSSMLDNSLAHFADLMFHELTHRTLWIAEEVEFNEQLASFVGRKLAQDFLLSRGEAKALDDYNFWHSDKKLYIEWLTHLISELQDLYKNSAGIDSSILLTKKSEIFTKYLTQLRPAFKKADFIGKEPWNNATVLAASLYSPDFDKFQKAYDCTKAQTAGEFLAKIKLISSKSENAEDWLTGLCAGE